MATEIDKAYKKESPIAGNGLFAKEAIAEGELIFSIPRPLFTELDSYNLPFYCTNCFIRSGDGLPGSDEVKIKACTGCNVVYYCSKTCQSVAWKRQHKPQCSIWKSVARGKELPHVVRLVAQVLVVRKNAKMSDDDWDAFESLPSHVDKLRQRADFETHAVMAMGALKYSGVEMFWDFEEVLEIYARILTNSLTITTPTLYPIGVGVDPFASCANHSCAPNAFVVLEGTRLAYRALRSIAKDDEIFMSYVDDTFPLLHRQKELRDRYYFDCNCSKCRDKFDTIEDRLQQHSPEQERRIARYASALAGRGGPKDPPSDTPLPATDEFLIYRLSGKLPRRISKPSSSTSPLSPDLYALEAYALNYVENDGGRKSLEIGPPVRVMWLLSSTGVWPAHRQPFPSLVEDYLRRAASNGQDRQPGFCNLGALWMFAVFRYILIDPILYPAHHPLRTLHAFSLANWSMTMLEDYEAKQRKILETGLGAALKKRIDFAGLSEDFLREAKATVARSHGPHSRFAQTVLKDSNFVFYGPRGYQPGYDESKKQQRRRVLEEVAKVVDEKKSTWFREMLEGRWFGEVVITSHVDDFVAPGGPFEAALCSQIERAFGMSGLSDSDSWESDEE